MCDYSLEMYVSRMAREGESLKTSRFPSGTIGIVDPNDCATAVCLTYGTKMTLANLPQDLMDIHDLKSTEKVEFARMDQGFHHDAVEFKNGAVVTLQRLGVGVSFTFTTVAAPAEPVTETSKAAKDLPASITALLKPREVAKT